MEVLDLNDENPMFTQPFGYAIPISEGSAVPSVITTGVRVWSVCGVCVGVCTVELLAYFSVFNKLCFASTKRNMNSVAKFSNHHSCLIAKSQISDYFLFISLPLSPHPTIGEGQ